MRTKADWFVEAYMNALWGDNTVVSSNTARNSPRDETSVKRNSHRDYASANWYGWYNNPYDFDRDWINERIRDWHLTHEDDSTYRIITLEQTVRALEDRIRTLESVITWLEWELRTKIRELEESAWFSYVKLDNDR